jgi:hypothetical protein
MHSAGAPRPSVMFIPGGSVAKPPHVSFKSDCGWKKQNMCMPLAVHHVMLPDGNIHADPTPIRQRLPVRHCSGIVLHACLSTSYNLSPSRILNKRQKRPGDQCSDVLTGRASFGSPRKGLFSTLYLLINLIKNVQYIIQFNQTNSVQNKNKHKSINHFCNVSINVNVNVYVCDSDND